jgi:hypothetical protein
LAGAVATAIAVASPGARAIQVDIGPQVVQRAISLAKRPDTERIRFHERYIFTVGDATLDRVEVISEFRRAVLAAEERVRMGDHLFGVRDLEPALRPWRGRLSVLAHLRLHPHNTYSAVPPFDLVVEHPPASGPILPLHVERRPVYSFAGDPAGASYLAGAVVEATFDARGVAGHPSTVSLRRNGDVIASVKIDFKAVD